jgi:hypothetical protein
MLAQNFKTAADLGLSDVEFSSLVTVLGMLERGEISDSHFDMTSFRKKVECGTIGCLCGWAHEVSGGKAFPELVVAAPLVTTGLLARLSPELRGVFWINANRVVKVRPADAAPVLRTYLMTGKNTWPAEK